MKWDWLSSNFSRLVELGIAHANLAWPPILLALLVALPIGWVAHRYRRIREIVVGLSSALYIIPSLALFILLPLVIGTSVLSSLNVIIAMTLYGLALQVRSTADSFDTVPAAVASAATAMGYSPLQRVFQVELPLAGPGIIAGLRVVSASTISLISVGALVGVHSLGTLFTEGFQRNFPTQIIAGFVGTVLLAVLFDLLLVLIGRVLLPWARKAS
ncbi:ABC transporter permease [Corynebacterium striatum]|uniref:ABC transporter permease subunit n=1 Tax=Corynebacterium striatum TaxID=43770 RepID=A0AAN5HPF2_CORST|nr:ABC transporter permease subunit [Corynebacterium striatum]EEI77555.1 ABC transporter, permease protein [Corynebacterium striatum ATCC 6940]EGT5575492.1 ABC transporter permease subunit [Corynebacterium striatum]EGT5590759.1 ABC transporter permease subunit [Corynebacterium striatum]EGT5593873.1 ABC transporter permease subunit [Corynebacterium striatum]EGT5786391.1 ABC transporter permease subunit [Corynebacterium striatum]